MKLTFNKYLKFYYSIKKMETIQEIKPGPKPKTDDGNYDQRRRVNPDNQPKYPDLKPHKHQPGD